MKYLIYSCDIGAQHVDIFSEQITHFDRWIHIQAEFPGLVVLKSAGRFKFSDKELDEFEVTPGSSSLNLKPGELDGIADQVSLKHALIFF